jgi:hypothetical protein
VDLLDVQADSEATTQYKHHRELQNAVPIWCRSACSRKLARAPIKQIHRDCMKEAEQRLRCSSWTRVPRDRCARLLEQLASPDLRSDLRARPSSLSQATWGSFSSPPPIALPHSELGVRLGKVAEGLLGCDPFIEGEKCMMITKGLGFMSRRTDAGFFSPRLDIHQDCATTCRTVSLSLFLYRSQRGQGPLQISNPNAFLRTFHCFPVQRTLPTFLKKTPRLGKVRERDPTSEFARRASTAVPIEVPVTAARGEQGSHITGDNFLSFARDSPFLKPDHWIFISRCALHSAGPTRS